MPKADTGRDKPGDKETEKWITVGGKKIKIEAGEEGEEALREKLPSARGVKESGTKQAQKQYEQRHDLIKSIFETREKVVFDKYEREGFVSGFEGDFVTIMSKGRVYRKAKNDVFKKSELLGDVHWDTITKSDRVKLLEKSNLPTDYSGQNWGNLSPEIRSALLKNNSPAGMSTSTAGSHNPIYNPINEEKPVSQRIKEEISRQHKYAGAGLEDEKKGKD